MLGIRSKLPAPVTPTLRVPDSRIPQQRGKLKMAQNFPWEYLSECSEMSLQNFLLAQLNLAASIRKIIAAEQEKLIEALTNAEVARIIHEDIEKLSHTANLRQGILDFRLGSEPTEHKSVEIVSQSEVPVKRAVKYPQN